MPYKRNHMHINMVCVPASEWEFQLCGKPLELSFQLIKDKLYVHVYLVYFHSMCNKTVLLLVFAASSYLIMYLLTHSNYPPHHQIRTQLISHSFSTSSFALGVRKAFYVCEFIQTKWYFPFLFICLWMLYDCELWLCEYDVLCMFFIWEFEHMFLCCLCWSVFQSIFFCSTHVAGSDVRKWVVLF